MKYVDVTAKKSTGERLFYHNDHLGGTHVITDMGTQQTGQRTELIEYDPWGVVSRSEGNSDATRRFTGQKLDPETALMYYGGRYYDPVLGRFVSPDPFVPAQGNPQSLNRYAYALNNPVRFVDPSGYFWKELGQGLGKIFHFTLGVDRYAIPVAAGIAVTVVTSGCVPCGGAVAGSLAGGLNTIYYGGSISDVARNAAIGGAIGGIAAATGNFAGIVAQEIAIGAASEGTSVFVGVVVGAAVGGAANGALHAVAYGGSISGSAMTGAAIAAVAAAVAYGGYQAYDSLTSSPATSTAVPDDPALVVAVTRRLASWRSLVFGASHKLYVTYTPGPEGGVQWTEMGPEAGATKVYQTDMNKLAGLRGDSIKEIQNGNVRWGEWSMVSRSALIAARNAYMEGLPYHFYFRNSNYFVNTVLRAAGANPHVPGAFAPAFGF